MLFRSKLTSGCESVEGLKDCKVILPDYNPAIDNHYDLHVSLLFNGKVFFEDTSEVIVEGAPAAEASFDFDRNNVAVNDPEGITLSLYLKDAKLHDGDYSDKIRFAFIDENGKATDKIVLLTDLSKKGPGLYKQTVGAKAKGVYVAKAMVTSDAEFSLNVEALSLNFTPKVISKEKSKIFLEPKEIWSDVIGGSNKPHETKVIFSPKHDNGTIADLGDTITFNLSSEDKALIPVKAKKVSDHYEAQVFASLFKDNNYAPREKVYDIKVVPYAEDADLGEGIFAQLLLHKLDFDAKAWVSDFKIDKDEISFKEKTFVEISLKGHNDTSFFAKDLHVAFVGSAKTFSTFGASEEDGEDATIGTLINSSENKYRVEFFAGEKAKTYKLGLYHKDELLRDVNVKVYDPSMSFVYSRLSVDRHSSYVIDKKGILLKLMARDGRDAPLVGASEQIGLTLKGSDGTVDVYETLEPFKETSPGIYALRVRSDKPITYEAIAYKILANGDKLYMTDKAQRISFGSYVMQAQLSSDRDNVSITDARGIGIRLTIQDAHGIAEQYDYSDRLSFVIKDEQGDSSNVRVLSSLKKLSDNVYGQFISAKVAGTYHIHVDSSKADFIIADNDLKVNFVQASLPAQGVMSLGEKELWWDELGNEAKPHETKVIFTPKHSDGTFAYLGEAIEFKLTNEGGSSIFVKAQKADDHYEALVKTSLFKSEDYAPRDKAYAIKILPFLEDLDFPSNNGAILLLHRPALKSDDWISDFKADKDALYFNEKTFVHVALKDNIEASIFAKDLRVAFVDQNQRGSEDATIGALTNSSGNAYKAEFFAGFESQTYEIGLYYKDKLLHVIDIKVYDPSMSFENSILSVDRSSSCVLDAQGILLQLTARDGRNAPLTGAADQIGFTLKGSDGTVDVYKTLEGFKETSSGLYSLRVGSDKARSYEVVAYKRLADGSKLYMTNKVQKISFVPYVMQAQLSSDRDNVSITDQKGIELRLTIEDLYGTAAQQDYSDKFSFIIKDAQGNSSNVRILSSLKKLSDNVYGQSISAKTAGTYYVEVNSSTRDFTIADNHLTVNFSKASLPVQSVMFLEKKEIWWDELGNKGKPHETKVIFTPKHSDGTFAYLGEEIAFKLTNEGGSSVLLIAQKLTDHYEALVKTASFKSEDYVPRDEAYAIKIVPFLSGLDFPSDSEAVLTLHRPVFNPDDWISEFKVDKDELYYKEKVFIDVVLKSYVETDAFMKDLRVAFADNTKEAREDAAIGELIYDSGNIYKVEFFAGSRSKAYKVGLYYKDKLLRTVDIKVYDPSMSFVHSRLSVDRHSSHIPDKNGVLLILFVCDERGTVISGISEQVGLTLKGSDGTIDAYETLEPFRETGPGTYTLRIRSDKPITYEAIAYKILSNGSKLYMTDKARKISFVPYVMQGKLSSDRDNISIADEKGIEICLTIEDPYGTAAQQDYSDQLSFVIKDEQGNSDNVRFLSNLKKLSDNVYGQFISAKVAGTYHIHVDASITDFAIADNHLKINFSQGSLPVRSAMPLGQKGF